MLYVPIIDDNAGMINDPVLLKLAKIDFGFPLQTQMFCYGPKGWQLASA